LVPGCSQSAIRCDGGLIYTFHGASLAKASAIDIASYRALASATSLATAIQSFGKPMSVAALKSFLGGSSFLSILIKSQPVNDSCAYYLQTANRTTRAFQLCFNQGQSLVSKAIISTSGSPAAPAGT
jgi:hypothetical protein